MNDQGGAENRNAKEVIEAINHSIKEVLRERSREMERLRAARTAVSVAEKAVDAANKELSWLIRRRRDAEEDPLEM
jgi:hypothetical protein